MQMKKIRLFSLMISLLATAVTFSACSDDDDETNTTPVPAPAVTLAKGEVTAESIAFTLTPANAVKAKWAYFEEGVREVTAEQVLANGTTADADKASELEIAPLNAETAYVIYAAVEGEDGTQVLSDPLKVTTLASNTPEPLYFEGAEASAEFFNQQSRGYNLWDLTLKDADQNELRVNLLVSLDADKSYLPGREFDSEDQDSFDGKLLVNQYTYVIIGGENGQVESGVITTEPDLEMEPGTVLYAIMGQLTLTDGRMVNVSYEGPVAGCNAPDPGPVVATIEISFTHAELWDTPEPGVFQVKLSDKTNWWYSGGLRFKAAATDTYLPSGHYSLADGTIFGEAISYVTTDYPNEHEAPGYARDWKSCEAEVMLEEGIYYLDVNI